MLWKLYEKYPSIQKEYGAIQPLLLHTTSPNFLITSKKQVKTLEDLKGLKIRTLGGPPIEMAKALGAVPAVLPMPDMYQALDKGVFDGAAVPWEAVHAFRLYEVAKNVTMVPFYASYFSLCANRAEDPEPAEGRARHPDERQADWKARSSGARTSSTAPRAGVDRARRRRPTSRSTATTCRPRRSSAGRRPPASRSGRSG